MQKKNIAIMVENFVQFYSIKEFIDNYKNANIDLFVPDYASDTGFVKMFDALYDYLVKNKYRVYRKSDESIKYDILLETYPYMSINHKYRIKYTYAFNSAKPNIVYKSDWNIYYDAILCHSTFEKAALSNFAETYLVGRLNFIGYKHKKTRNERKTLLYLPTYGNVNSIDAITEQLSKISKKYDIIIKEHHGTDYLNKEDKDKNILNSYFKKVYDSSTPLIELLEEADVVLSDNSAAIFDALYASVPVCIFSEDLKSCSLQDLDPLQCELVEKGAIPYTNNINELQSIIDLAFDKEYVKKQEKASKELFPIRGNDIYKSFVNIIDKYLNEDFDDNEKAKIKLHRIIIDEYNNMLKNIEDLNKNNTKIIEENNQLKNEKDNLKAELNQFKSGKLYKFATKIYTIRGK